MNPLDGTRQAYEKIASDYAVAWQGRGPVKQALQRFVALLPPGSMVLDVGCGPGFDTAVLRQHLLYAIGVDFTWGMMQAGRGQGITADFVQADMRQLPFVCQLDGLWVCASLLHLPRADVPATLQEFHRLLKPGGILHLSVKQGQGEEWTQVSYGRSAPRFFTYWQAEELDEALKTAEFTLLEGWLDNTPHASWLVRFAQKSHKT